MLETSHPPTIYVPPEDVDATALRPAAGSSLCEWKGRAAYFDVVGADGGVAERAAWSYPAPAPAFAALAGHVAFYPGRVEAAYLDEQRVIAQKGDFYGGWITADLAGPFKGAPGARGW